MTRINKRQAQALAFAAMSVISLGVGLSSRLQPLNKTFLAGRHRGMKVGDVSQSESTTKSTQEMKKTVEGAEEVSLKVPEPLPEQQTSPLIQQDQNLERSASNEKDSRTEETNIDVPEDSMPNNDGSDPDQSQTSLLMVEEETKAIRKFVVQVLMTEQSHQLKEILKIETQLCHFQGFATIGFLGLVMFFVLLAGVDHPAMFAPICLFLAGFTGFQVGALQRTNKLQNKVNELLDDRGIFAHSMLKEGTCGGPRNFAPIALSKFLNNEEQTAGALNEALNQKAISDNISMELAVRIIRRCVTLRQVRRYCRDNEVPTPHT